MNYIAIIYYEQSPLIAVQLDKEIIFEGSFLDMYAEKYAFERDKLRLVLLDVISDFRHQNGSV